MATFACNTALCRLCSSYRRLSRPGHDPTGCSIGREDRSDYAVSVCRTPAHRPEDRRPFRHGSCLRRFTGRPSPAILDGLAYVRSGRLGDPLGHVTFVHGIGNKPEPSVLLEHWRVALLDDDGIDLASLGVSSSLVYWADVLYPQPLVEASGDESAELELAPMVDAAPSDMSWLASLPPQERAFVERLGIQVGLATVASTPGDDLEAIVADSPLEAVPLPAGLKRRLMRAFLRDVHHYLYDVEFSPRNGESFQVRQDVRARTVAALANVGAVSRPHVVIGHSLGSVVAYDVLVNCPDTPLVDGMITVGSPLGLSAVQGELTPPYTRNDGWPERCLADGRWVNVSDGLDPVCGADPLLGGDFRRQGMVRVDDIAVKNRGSWRHSIGKYLGQPQLRNALRAMLQ
jgi:pimeloyl-ACP methyl ester carboxylesterase